MTARTTVSIAIVALLGTAVPRAAAASWIDVQTFTLPPDGAWAATAGPDGAMWVGGGNTISRIAPDGAITSFMLPTSCPGADCGVRGITPGPDGALWFTVFNGNSIGRITTDGAITEFPLPTRCGFADGCGPHGIAAGPDGALWFTEARGDRIGRMTTTGQVIEFPACCGPAEVAAGHDNDLWFTSESKSINRITTSGVMQSFSLPCFAYDCQATGVTRGPAGTMWITFAFGGIVPSPLSRHWVGVYTAAGSQAEWPVFGSRVPRGITAAPDGAFWFTQGERLGRITLDGKVWQLPLNQEGFFARTITLGPDGALWLTGRSDVAARAPVCFTTVLARFADSTLTLDFRMATPTPVTWNTGYFWAGGLAGLWSRPIPPIVPERSFTVPVGPGFPSLGRIAVVTTLQDAATGRFLCAGWHEVDTGGPGATEDGIRQMIQGGFWPRP